LKIFKKSIKSPTGIDKEEDLGKNIWQKLNVIEVNKVMVPRSEIVSIPMEASKDELMELINSSKHARIPVYEGDLDNVLGFVHIKDVIRNYDRNFTISDILRNIIFVPALIKLSGVLAKMKSSQVHAAIVLDEYGGTEGLVTIKDIIEEIIGDIDDEHHMPYPSEKLVSKISENEFEVLAKITIEELEKFVGKSFDFGDDGKYRTLNGFIFNLLNEVAKVGETIRYKDVEITIMDANSKLVNKILLTIIKQD